MGVRVSGKPKWAVEKRANGQWKWSQKENDFVKEHAGEQSVEWIAEKLGRTVHAVQKHAHKKLQIFLGIKSKPWTKSENSFLRKYAGQESCEWIAEKLGRSEASAAHQLHVLGLQGVNGAERKARMLQALTAPSIAKINALKGKRVQLSTGGWVTHTGNVILFERENDQGYNVPELLCEIEGHLFPAPSFRLSSYPSSCPLCVEQNGGRIQWQRILQTARVFGLTSDEYLAMRKRQRVNGKVCCAICFSTEVDKKMSVDHDHACCNLKDSRRQSCGDCVRELLCVSCNSIVGMIENGKIPRGMAPKHDSYVVKWRRRTLRRLAA